MIREKNFNCAKSSIEEYLKNVHKSPSKRAHELVELLEDKSVLESKFNINLQSKEYKTNQKQYQAFCKAYIIHVFKTFIVVDDDTEIMLLSFNYLPEFENVASIDERRKQYAEQIYMPKHPEKRWKKDKASGMRTEETRIIEELADVLAKLIVKQNGKLDLIDDVLKNMGHEDSSRTLSENLEAKFPSPKNENDSITSEITVLDKLTNHDEGLSRRPNLADLLKSRVLVPLWLILGFGLSFFIVAVMLIVSKCSPTNSIRSDYSQNNVTNIYEGPVTNYIIQSPKDIKDNIGEFYFENGMGG